MMHLCFLSLLIKNAFPKICPTDDFGIPNPPQSPRPEGEALMDGCVRAASGDRDPATLDVKIWI